MKLSGFGSTSYVRFFCFCSPAGLWARRLPCPHFHRLGRRADLGGHGVVFDPAFVVVAADAARPVKESVRAVGIDMDLDPRLDEMGAHRAFWDLQLERPVRDAIVIADLPLLLDAQDLVEVDAGNGREGRAFAGRIDGEAGVVRRQIDASMSVMRASLSSFGSRSCSVLKARSDRPLAWGEKAPIGSMPN